MDYSCLNQESGGILIFVSKFASEIRMDYWYLWKTHFLNFRDFQESLNPLKIPIPTLDVLVISFGITGKIIN